MSRDSVPRVSARTLTVADVAALFAVTAEVVCAWIASGELRATNVARSANAKRPTWRITETALAAFEAARSSTLTAPEVRCKRKPKPAPGDVVEFYS